MKSNQVAQGVRVKLNENFIEKCLGDKYLMEQEEVIFISEGHIYNDARGEYVFIKGGSLMNSGYAYLDQLDLEFPIPTTPIAIQVEPLTVYAIKNSNGEFFRAKGYGRNGSTWVDNINNAKIYTRIGSARAIVTWFANHYPDFRTPDLLKLTVNKVEVMDETSRVAKVKDKKALEDKRRAEAKAERDLKDAQTRYDKASADLNNLKKS
jgi:hypothetical protein